MVTTGKLAQAAVVIMVVTFAGRLVGFLREVFIAAHFPVELIDTYLLAYTIPNLLGMTVSGAFVAAMIPIFTQRLVEGDRERAWRLGSAVLNLVFLVFLALVIVGILFAPTIVKLIGPGFEGERAHLTAQLMIIMLPALIAVALGGISMGMLNSMNRFFTPSLGPVVSSSTIILSIFLLPESWGIYRLAVGTLAGLSLQLLVQVPTLRKEGFRYYPVLGLKDPDVKRIGILILPVLVGVGINQINVLIDRILASGLPAGSIAALNYANLVLQLPMGIIVAPIAMPIFPALAALATQAEDRQMKSTMIRGTNFYSILLFPITVGLMVLAEPMIRLLFERGEFTPENTAATAFALFFYALGLWPAAIRDLLTRVFYSLQDTKTPVQIAAASVVVHIALNLILIRYLAHGGLALATSIANLLNMVILGWILYRRTGGWPMAGALMTLLKVSGASAAMGVLVFWAKNHLTLGLEGTLGTLIQVGGSIALGALFYGLVLMALKVEEVGMVLGWLKDKVENLRRRRSLS